MPVQISRAQAAAELVSELSIYDNGRATLLLSGVESEAGRNRTIDHFEVVTGGDDPVIEISFLDGAPLTFHVYDHSRSYHYSSGDGKGTLILAGFRGHVILETRARVADLGGEDLDHLQAHRELGALPEVNATVADAIPPYDDGDHLLCPPGWE